MSKNWAIALAVSIWIVIIIAFLYLTAAGSQGVRTWIETYGGLLSTILVAAITTVYVLLTHQHVRIAQLVYRYQFGAGVWMEFVQEEKESPPTFRIVEAYAYPEEYRRRAFPRLQEAPPEGADNMQASIRYEMLRIYNERDNPIRHLHLRVVLRHRGFEKAVFNYTHTDPIAAKDRIEIGIWPVENMPNYHLTIGGTYTDAIGTFKLPRQEVDR